MVFWKIPLKVKFIMTLIFFGLLFFKVVNISLFFCLVIIGASMNFTTIITNNWIMPVRKVGKHKILNKKNGKYMTKKEAKFYCLADIHKVGNRMVSKGDFIILIGIILGGISYFTKLI